MNDAGIIKALECFAIDKDFDESCCIGCAFETKSICCENASNGIARKALHTIKCQQAEIEKLKLENHVLSQNRITMPERLEIVNNAKDKAIREFADKLKNCAESSRDYSEWVFTINESALDNLVKQMTVRIDKNESERHQAPHFFVIDSV